MNGITALQELSFKPYGKYGMKSKKFNGGNESLYYYYFDPIDGQLYWRYGSGANVSDLQVKVLLTFNDWEIFYIQRPVSTLEAIEAYAEGKSICYAPTAEHYSGGCWFNKSSCAIPVIPVDKIMENQEVWYIKED
jgi:hypothetical protein